MITDRSLGPTRHDPACCAGAQPAPPLVSGPCTQSLSPVTTDAAPLCLAGRAYEVTNPDYGASHMRSWLNQVHRAGLRTAAATARRAS